MVVWVGLGRRERVARFFVFEIEGDKLWYGIREIEVWLIRDVGNVGIFGLEVGFCYY